MGNHQSAADEDEEHSGATAVPVAPDASDESYFNLLAGALQTCITYKPKLGTGRKAGLTLAEFQTLYRADPFYCWVGLDSPLMYAAHKAAGGMTSVYRQLGIGCQWIFSNILQDTLGLTPSQAAWTYQVPTPGGTPRSLSLDGRINFADVSNPEALGRLKTWLSAACDRLLIPAATRDRLDGVVFEVRQGYKSMDSKRQNADITNATNAYNHSYMPILLLLSTQIDGVLATRYTQAQWLLLRGSNGGNALESTYTFTDEILGYGFAQFFERNSARIKVELESVLDALLRPEP
jgi:hypothetical protein